MKQKNKIPKDWVKAKLKDIGTFDKGVGISKEDISNVGYPCVRYGEIYTKYNFKIRNFISFIPKEISLTSKQILKGDILFTGSGETAEEIAKCVACLHEDIAYAGGDIIIFKLLDKKQNSLFYSYFFNTIGRKQINRLAEGNSIVHIYPEELGNINISLPPIKEQEKIVEILELWDKAIETTKKLIEQKQLQKKYLMQKLLTGKIRLKGFKDKWKKVNISSFLIEIDNRTTENNQFEVLSVTKNGIFSQKEYFDKQIASKNNMGYKIIRKNNIVFSSMNLWMGSLGFCEYEVGMISPAYKTFKINEEKTNFNFLKYFMKTPKMLHLYEVNSDKGASIVRRNLNLEQLLSSKIDFPDLKEQEKIADILLTADKQIDLLEQKLSNLELQKKGLMQKLLTGEIRVC